MAPAAIYGCIYQYIEEQNLSYFAHGSHMVVPLSHLVYTLNILINLKDGMYYLAYVFLRNKNISCCQISVYKLFTRKVGHSCCSFLAEF